MLWSDCTLHRERSVHTWQDVVIIYTKEKTVDGKDGTRMAIEQTDRQSTVPCMPIRTLNDGKHTLKCSVTVKDSGKIE